MDKVNILVLGRRKGLVKALKDMRISYYVCKIYPEDMPKDTSEFSHVLASGEGTVVLANIVREALGLKIIPPRTIELCSDKLAMKEFAKEKGIPVTVFFRGGTGLSSEEIYQKLGNKVVVKDRNNSGGKGQRIFSSPEPIYSTSDQLIESFVFHAKEMSVESFIENGEIKFTSTTYYQELGVINIVPSCLDKDKLREVLEVNEKVIKTYRVQEGITHLEVYLTEEGVVFGEVALRPPGGHIMTLMEKAHGIKPWELYVKLHLGEEVGELQSQGMHAATIIYHPGAGEVEEIRAKDNISDLETLVAHKIKAEVGDIVGVRDGVGKEQAHFIFQSRDRAKLEKEVHLFREKFSIKLKDA